jgi:hypothetical protein
VECGGSVGIWWLSRGMCWFNGDVVAQWECGGSAVGCGDSSVVAQLWDVLAQWGCEGLDVKLGHGGDRVAWCGCGGLVGMWWLIGDVVVA